jgi:hypothetical protein
VILDVALILFLFLLFMFILCYPYIYIYLYIYIYIYINLDNQIKVVKRGPPRRTSKYVRGLFCPVNLALVSPF